MIHQTGGDAILASALDSAASGVPAPGPLGRLWLRLAPDPSFGRVIALASCSRPGSKEEVGPADVFAAGFDAGDRALVAVLERAGRSRRSSVPNSGMPIRATTSSATGRTAGATCPSPCRKRVSVRPSPYTGSASRRSTRPRRPRVDRHVGARLRVRAPAEVAGFLAGHRQGDASVNGVSALPVLSTELVELTGIEPVTS
jgi:hypothetical protein